MVEVHINWPCYNKKIPITDWLSWFKIMLMENLFWGARLVVLNCNYHLFNCISLITLVYKLWQSWCTNSRRLIYVLYVIIDVIPWFITDNKNHGKHGRDKFVYTCISLTIKNGNFIREKYIYHMLQRVYTVCLRISNKGIEIRNSLWVNFN